MNLGDFKLRCICIITDHSETQVLPRMSLPCCKLASTISAATLHHTSMLSMCDQACMERMMQQLVSVGVFIEVLCHIFQESHLHCQCSVSVKHVCQACCINTPYNNAHNVLNVLMYHYYRYCLHNVMAMLMSAVHLDELLKLLLHSCCLDYYHERHCCTESSQLAPPPPSPLTHPHPYSFPPNHLH